MLKLLAESAGKRIIHDRGGQCFVAPCGALVADGVKMDARLAAMITRIG
jgi:hypothetical protein